VVISATAAVAAAAVAAAVAAVAAGLLTVAVVCLFGNSAHAHPLLWSHFHLARRPL
jgi:hypothetical protein